MIPLATATVPLDAHRAPLYQKTIDPLVRQTKRAVTFCKKKIADRKKSIIKRELTQKQLMYRLLAAGFLIGFSLAFFPQLSLPYTERKFLDAVRNDDRDIVNDHLSNKRISPNVSIEGERVLWWAAICKHKEVVKRLMDAGADPRLKKNNTAYESIVDEYDIECALGEESYIACDPEIQQMFQTYARLFSSREEIQCLEIAIKKLRTDPKTAPEHLPPEPPVEIYFLIREFLEAPSR